MCISCILIEQHLNNWWARIECSLSRQTEVGLLEFSWILITEERGMFRLYDPATQSNECGLSYIVSLNSRRLIAWLEFIFFKLSVTPTLCLKKVSTLQPSVSLWNLNRFSKFLYWSLLQNPYNTTHLTLGMLLHYLGKLKLQIFCRCGRKRKQSAFFVLFVIHPQILIFSVFKIAALSPCWLQIRFSMSLFFCLFTFTINLCPH